MKVILCKSRRILKYALYFFIQLEYFQIKGDLKDVAISPTGRFIMVSTVTTTVYIYTLKGMCLSFHTSHIHESFRSFDKILYSFTHVKVKQVSSKQ